MLTVTALLALAAFICVLLSALNWVPLWVGTLLLCILELLRIMPLGK